MNGIFSKLPHPSLLPLLCFSLGVLFLLRAADAPAEETPLRVPLASSGSGEAKAPQTIYGEATFGSGASDASIKNIQVPSLPGEGPYSLEECLSLALRVSPGLDSAEQAEYGAARGFSKKGGSDADLEEDKDPNISKLRALIASLRTAIIKDDLTLKLKSAYFKLKASEKSLAVAESSKNTLDELMGVLTQFYDIGMTTGDKSAGGKLKLSEAERELKKREKELLVNKANLNILLKRAPEDPLKIADDLVYSPFPLSLEETLNKALANNPELLLARTRAELLTAKVNLISKGSSSKGPKADSKASGGDALLMSQIRLNRAIDKLDLAEGEIKRIVFAFHQDLSLAGAEIEALDAEISEAQKYMDLIRERFMNFVATSDEYILAEELFVRAQMERTQALYNYNIAWAALEKAMGEPVLKKRAR
jgi:hypothetical protein